MVTSCFFSVKCVSGNVPHMVSMILTDTWSGPYDVIAASEPNRLPACNKLPRSLSKGWFCRKLAILDLLGGLESREENRPFSGQQHQAQFGFNPALRTMSTLITYLVLGSSPLTLSFRARNCPSKFGKRYLSGKYHEKFEHFVRFS